MFLEIRQDCCQDILAECRLEEVPKKCLDSIHGIVEKVSKRLRILDDGVVEVDE